MMTYRLFALAALFAVAGASFCQDVPEREWERGEFYPNPGREWNLPADLRVNSIIGWEDEIPTAVFPLLLSLRNDARVRRSLTMPAGLCFRPRDPEFSYMMLLQDFTFSVPPDDTTVLLPTWVANEDLDEPDDESVYDINLVAYDREITELLDLLRDKTIHDTLVDLDMLQDALWEITDEEGLTDSTRAWLRELP
ncbi:MAG TPA: hypothetical protein ENN51_01720 [candidate division WOR-3 bacterium]|uniref:DUF928 domain-containing protein n=1 Tax=candidate division WOR-3 bacterium TaxID=2052148 RepID=A0A7V0T526_UNCW3|nr:hypothetical protein [candidate division WOR-3 bacterium]